MTINNKDGINKDYGKVYDHNNDEADNIGDDDVDDRSTAVFVGAKLYKSKEV